MKHLCVVLIIIFSIACHAEDPMRAILEVDDLYTLNLTINHLYRGFAYNNNQEVLSRIADTYEEGGRTYNSNDYSSRVQDIFSQKNSTASNSDLDLILFCKPLNIDKKDNKAEVTFNLTAYIPVDNEYHVNSRDCTLYLSKIGSGWQVYESDNWLSSLEDLFLCCRLSAVDNLF